MSSWGAVGWEEGWEKGGLRNFEHLGATVTHGQMHALQSCWQTGSYTNNIGFGEFGAVYAGFFTVHVGKPISDPCI